MPLETDELNQKAVLRASDGSSYDDYGEKKIGIATEINVRWKQGRSTTIDVLGNTVALDSKAIVDREVKVGSVMWLGELECLPVSGSIDWREVVDYSEIPDIKGEEVRRLVSLQKYSLETPASI